MAYKMIVIQEKTGMDYTGGSSLGSIGDDLTAKITAALVANPGATVHSFVPQADKGIGRRFYLLLTLP